MGRGREARARPSPAPRAPAPLDRSRSRDLEDGRKQWCVIFTTKVAEQALAKLDGVRHAACIFQEYVPKKVELRVTVIGDKVFACEIHSQVHDASAVDFRRHYALEST